jgi:N-ATPase, AtpR subunit
VLVRLEMDGERMSSFAFGMLSPWVMAFSLSACFVVGIAAGLLYFRSVWWNAGRLAGGGRVSVTVALVIGRFALLGTLLTSASLHGAPPLLAVALGILVARPLIMRRFGGAPR